MTEQRPIAGGTTAGSEPSISGVAAASPLREVKVSAHVMALDPGLYCLVHTASGAAAPSRGGLPAVRVAASPQGGAGSVAVATLPGDGWLHPDDGALIRVTGGGAEVMVTVYQDPGSAAEAPRLQVLRLSAEASAIPEAVHKAGVAEAGVLAHVYGLGDVVGPVGAWIGEPGGTRWIEGFAVTSAGSVPLSDVEYQAVLGRGWMSPWSSGGQYCGSRGMSLPILGLCLRLRGASAASHRVQLWARFVDGTEMGPVNGDTLCEAPSFAALEAFRLVLEPAAATPRVARRR